MVSQSEVLVISTGKNKMEGHGAFIQNRDSKLAGIQPSEFVDGFQAPSTPLNQNLQATFSLSS